MAKKRILVADDEETLRLLISDTLEDADFEIDLAADGDEAFALLTANSYDLAVLDVMMPGKTGYELCEEAKKMAKPPLILILSAKAQAADQNRALKAGADRVLTKPFSPLALQTLVEEMLEGSR